MPNVRYYIFLLGMLFLAPACREKTASDFEIWGLDVSRHQQNVNWEKVIESEKPYFVLIKATEGTLIVDPTYEQHRKELEKAGIPWGAYHFFGHRTSGKEQARNFIKTAKLQKGNFLPVLDIEPHRFMTDPKKMVREAKAFCNEIKRYSARRIFTKHTCTETSRQKTTRFGSPITAGAPSWTGKSGSIPIRIRFPAYGARSTGTSSEAVNKNFKS